MKARCAVVVTAALSVFSAEHALAEQARSGDGQEIEALANRIGCLQCHGVDNKPIGPAFQDIAARYKDNAGARAALDQRIKNGGKGNWTALTGGVPMPPFSALLSETEIAQLVDWILSR